MEVAKKTTPKKYNKTLMTNFRLDESTIRKLEKLQLMWGLKRPQALARAINQIYSTEYKEWLKRELRSETVQESGIQQ